MPIDNEGNITPFDNGLVMTPTGPRATNSWEMSQRKKRIEAINKLTTPPTEIEVAELVSVAGDIARRLAYQRDRLQTQITLLYKILQQCKAHIRNIMPDQGPLARQHAKMLDEIIAFEKTVRRV